MDATRSSPLIPAVAAAALAACSVARADVPVELVGQSRGYAAALAVAGNYAYVTDLGGTGLAVVDVSNPAAPVGVGAYGTDAYVGGVVVSGQYAYLTWWWYDDEWGWGWGGVDVIDVSDPAAPAYAGGWSTTDYFPSDVAVSGGYAYVVDESPGLQVWDVSSPAAPAFVSGCALRLTHHLVVSGSHAYLTDYSNGLQVIDISNPAAPLRVGGRGRNGGWTDAHEGRTDFAGGIIETEVSAPGYGWTQWPASEGGNGHWYALTASNTTWFDCRDEAIAAGGYLVTINDAAENAWLHQQFGTPGVVGQSRWIGFNDVATEGHWEWVGGDGGWWEKDNPASTSYVRWYADTPEPNGDVNENAAIINYAETDDLTSGIGQGVAVSGGYAYVAADSAGVDVIDISNPMAPVRVGGYSEVNWSTYDLAVSGGYACVAAGTAGLTVIDVSNPTAPVRVGGYASGDARDVAVSGGYVYMADASGDGLLILRVGAEPRPGDLDCDGRVNFDDIDPFVTALISQTVYEQQYPGCHWLNGDINDDGSVDFDDINPFVTCLVAGACP